MERAPALDAGATQRSTQRCLHPAWLHPSEAILPIPGSLCPYRIPTTIYVVQQAMCDGVHARLNTTLIMHKTTRE